jgi:PAS domain S-box-containing protein
MTPKNRHPLLSADSQAEPLLQFYRRTSFVLVPAVVIYLLLDAIGVYQITPFEKAQAWIPIGVGVYIFLFHRKEWAVRTFYVFTLVFLLAETLLNPWWYIAGPSETNLIGLMLTVFIVGIVLIQPIVTVVYFGIVLSLMTAVILARNPEDFKYVFYVFFCAVIITGFSVWRRRIERNSALAKEGYRNLFSDSSELIFVLDSDMKIIEINKSAADYIRPGMSGQVEGKHFNDIFCADDPHERSKFITAIKEAGNSEKTRFEANCSLVNTTDNVPKEFTVRKSTYFENNVIILTIRLIKEQRDYEQKLIESKENISRVIENINSFIFNITYHPEGNHQVNYVSNKVEEVYGIDVDEYITLVKSNRLNEIFYHEDRAEAVQLFNDVITTGQQNRLKFRIVRDKEVRWVEEKIFPKKNAQTGVVFLFGIVTDITDQIESLRTIEESEARYRQIFERNMAGVYKTHVDGTILEANPAFARILGYRSTSELIGQNISRMYYEQGDRKKYIEQLRRDGSINNYISRLVRKDGRKLLLNNNVSIQPDDDGVLNIIEGTLIDITDLEETAGALKLSEEKYRLLFEEANTGIILLSNQGKDSFIIDLNQVGKQLFGYGDNELSGLKLGDIAVNAKELQEKVFVLNRSENKKEKLEVEWKFKRKNGQDFFAEVSFISIFLGTEKIMQAVVKDISERKKNEKELLESQRSFKNIVDNSPASILIFTNNELVYKNPSGQRLYDELLNSKSLLLYEVFPEKLKFVLEELVLEKADETNSYTEIDLEDGSNKRKFSVSAVKTVYNNKRSDLFLLQDITLQTEYNTQKLRAEIAEETNKVLQQEIVNHRKTQAELLEKTFWLNALFESSYNLFILSLDKNYRISSFNENFKKMIRKSLDIEVRIGDVFLDLFKPGADARERIESRFRRVLQGETLELVSHFPAKKGEVWVESFLNPVKLGDREIVEISFISHEITDKIEAQRKTKMSEANNRAILLALPDILYKVSSKGFFIDYRINQPQGLDEPDGIFNTREFVGKHVLEVFIDREMAEKFMSNIHEAIYKNELITDTIELKPANGERRGKTYYENRFSKMNDDEVIVLSRNVTETIEYEEMLVDSVREKEILLKEVHHRVKNNLQVINSILNLQSSYVDDPKTLEIINESQNRIRSMSYIHESLYQTKDFSSINFADYITNLVQNLVHSYQLYHDKINLELNINPVRLALDQAIPCGLILNELMSNALKYAYPGKKKGKIAIDVTEENGKVCIQVQDFGVGLPAGFKVENSESLGLSLVYTLVDQLDGELKLKTDGGTKFLITFEKQNF